MDDDVPLFDVFINKMFKKKSFAMAGIPCILIENKCEWIYVIDQAHRIDAFCAQYNEAQ